MQKLVHVTTIDTFQTTLELTIAFYRHESSSSISFSTASGENTLAIKINSIDSHGSTYNDLRLINSSIFYKGTFIPFK